MKKSLRFLSFFLCVMLLLPMMTGCAAVRHPLTYLKFATERTVKRRPSGELLALAASVLSGGSVSCGFSGANPDLTPFESGQFTAYFSGEDKKIAANAFVTVGGTPYQGEVWFSPQELIVSSDTFFGSTDFGIPFDTLKRDLQNSIFRNNSGTDYARPEIGENTADEVETMVKGFFSLYTSLGDCDDILNEQIENFLDALTQYACYNRYSQKGRIYISVTVDNTSLSRALRDTRNKAVRDRHFCRRAREIAESRDAIVSARTGVVVTEWSDELEYWLMSDSKIESLCAEIDNAPAFSFQLDGSARRLTGAMEKISFSYRQTDRDTITAEADFSDDDRFYICVGVGNVIREFSITATKNSLRTYTADLYYSKKVGEEQALYAGSLSINRRKDLFSLSVRHEDDLRVFEGHYQRKSSRFSFSVDSAVVNGTATGFKFSLSLTTSDKIPEAPQYVNLPAVEEARFAAVYPRAKQAVLSLREGIGESHPTPRSILNYGFIILGIDEKIPEKD